MTDDVVVCQGVTHLAHGFFAPTAIVRARMHMARACLFLKSILFSFWENVEDQNFG
jgi:hypothetical protein